MADQSTPEEQQELVRAVANERDRTFATMLTMLIQLAAEQHPEALRAALAAVFNVEQVTAHAEFAKRVSQEALTLASNARLAAQDAAQRLDEQHKDLDEIAKRIAAGRTYMQQLSDRVGKAFAFLNSRRTPSGKPPAAKGQQSAASEEK